MANYIFSYSLDGVAKVSHTKAISSTITSVTLQIASDGKTLNVLNGSTIVDSYTYDTTIKEPTYEYLVATNTFSINAITSTKNVLTKGTYTWKLEPTLPEDGTSTTIDMSFKTEIGTPCIQMVLSLDKIQYSKKQASGLYQLKTAYDYMGNSWSTGDRTIIVEEDVTLTSTQYAMLITNGNLTKKHSHIQ